MHKLEVVLLVTVPVPGKPAETKFLLTRVGDDWMLPCDAVSQEQCSREVAVSLLSDFAGVDARWVKLKQCELFDSLDRLDEKGNRWVAIAYGCMLPETVKLPDPFVGWYTFEEVVAKQPLLMDHMEILTGVANQL